MQFTVVIVLFSLAETVLSGQYDSFMLSEHNRYRRMEGAANMQKMVWSTTLANAALGWAQTCTQGHQNGPEGYGENLYMYTKGNYPDKDLIEKGIKAWYDEKSLWSWGMGFTSATGHYTQLVWAKTNEVGCGTHICPAQGMFRRSYLYLACFYRPAGNFQGEDPYIRGSPCSKCSSGQQCDQGLCSGTPSGGSDTGSENNNAGSTDNGNSWDDNNNNNDNWWDTGNNENTWDDNNNNDNWWDTGNNGNTWDDNNNDNWWDTGNNGNTWDNNNDNWWDTGNNGNTWDTNTNDNWWDNNNNWWKRGKIVRRLPINERHLMKTSPVNKAEQLKIKELSDENQLIPINSQPTNQEVHQPITKDSVQSHLADMKRLAMQQKLRKLKELRIRNQPTARREYD